MALYQLQEHVAVINEKYNKKGKYSLMFSGAVSFPCRFAAREHNSAGRLMRWLHCCC
jgi:hypothetical protein